MENNMEKKIYELLNYCYEDSLINEIGKLNYQLFVISLKSMIPFENKIGCKFDEKRYIYELKTLKYYINGSDEIVENKIKGCKPLTKNDCLLEYKIIPIIIANTYWENIINEVLKCVIFYTFSKDSILQAIVLSSLLHEYIENNSMDFQYLCEITKERIIQFSIKQFYEDNFNISVKNNYIINFEKERISYLMMKNIFEILPIFNSKLVNYILNGDSFKNVVCEDNKVYIANFSSYLFKLRKGILDPTKLKFNCNDITDLKIHLENSSFIHPVLGKCIVISKNKNESIVKTKIGNIKVKQ